MLLIMIDVQSLEISIETTLLRSGSARREQNIDRENRTLVQGEEKEHNQWQAYNRSATFFTN